MKLKEGLNTDYIYLPRQLWDALGGKLDIELDIKIRKIDGSNAIIVKRRKI